jgi:hypothetical protein
MAKQKSGLGVPVRESVQVTEIIDLQIQISPRGRSVMNGTLLEDGILRTFHRDLGVSDIKSIASAALGLVVDLAH